VPNDFFAISPDDLPSLDALAECSMDLLHTCHSGPFKGLHTSFSKFSETYCSMEGKLPLVGADPEQEKFPILIYIIEANNEQDITNEATADHFSSWTTHENFSRRAK
jgi:hypothetical protein